MKIPKARVPQIAREMLRGLSEEGDIETESPAEVELDLQSVLNQYIKDEAEISDKARELMARRGLPQSQLGQVRGQLAEQQKVKLGDDAIDYIVDQLIEFLMHSHNVAEIYAPDHRLRRVLREPLRNLAHLDEALDAQVRGQMKHVQEGSALWEVEYQRILEDVRRRKGI
jgi:uncharacterized protein